MVLNHEFYFQTDITLDRSCLDMGQGFSLTFIETYISSKIQKKNETKYYDTSMLQNSPFYPYEVGSTFSRYFQLIAKDNCVNTVSSYEVGRGIK